METPDKTDLAILVERIAHGRGTISVVANVAPRLCVEMHDALRRRDHDTATAIHQRLRPVMAALDLDTNPVPVKCALHFLLGLNPDVRLPLVEMLPETARPVGHALFTLAGDDEEAPRVIVSS